MRSDVLRDVATTNHAIRVLCQLDVAGGCKHVDIQITAQGAGVRSGPHQPAYHDVCVCLAERTFRTFRNQGVGLLFSPDKAGSLGRLGCKADF